MLDIQVMELVDLVGRWVLFFSVLSIIMPPVEWFEELFGAESKVTKFYRFFGKFVKYYGNLDFRDKMINLYPQYRQRIENGEKKIAGE